MIGLWVVVTGASSGIGKELAWEAARSGRSVILAARSQDKLDQLAAELRDTCGVEAESVAVDLAQPGGPDILWQRAVANDRRISVLVNNAGLGSHDRFVEAAWDREKQSIDVNVTALTRLMKLAVPHMVQNGEGRILNVGSVAGFIPGPNMAVYHATKAYVLSLSEAVANELHGTGVSVTALCPGATQSEFFKAADMRDVKVTKGRLASSEGVASLGWQAMMERQRIAIPGFSNRMIPVLARILPRRMVARMTGRVMSKT